MTTRSSHEPRFLELLARHGPPHRHDAHLSLVVPRIVVGHDVGIIIVGGSGAHMTVHDFCVEWKCEPCVMLSAVESIHFLFALVVIHHRRSTDHALCIRLTTRSEKSCTDL